MKPMSEQLDWYLHRKNCASCAKSEAWLAAQGIAAAEQVDARKQRFEEAQAWELVRGCSQVFVARGKSWAAYDPLDAEQAVELGKKMLGPHGTLRAPALRFGKVMIIGYEPEMYAAAQRAAHGAPA
jgi:arsenate reductase-like glutaredoxin family protein